MGGGQLVRLTGWGWGGDRLEKKKDEEVDSWRGGLLVRLIAGERQLEKWTARKVNSWRGEQLQIGGKLEG